MAGGSPISDVVAVTISITDTGITRAGFGTLMGLAPYMETPITRVELFDQDTAPETSGYASYPDPVVKAHAAHFKPDPKPELMAVGRIKVGWIVAEIDGDDFVAESEYKIKLHWLVEGDGSAELSEEFSYTGAYGEGADDVATQIAVEINAGTAPFEAAAVDEMVLIKSTVIGSVLPMTAWGESSGVWIVHKYGGMVDVDTDGDVQAAHTYNLVINETTLSFATILGTRAELYQGWFDAWDAMVTKPPEFFVIYLPGIDPSFLIINEACSCRVDLSCADTEVSRTFSYTYGETMVAAFDACRLASKAWYAFDLVDRTRVFQAACADKAESEITINGYASSDLDIPNTTLALDPGTIAGYCAGKNFTRTFGVYHSRATGYFDPTDVTNTSNEEWVDFGWFGTRLTVDLDEETATWKFAGMAGFTTDNLSATQKDNLFGSPTLGVSEKCCNFCDNIADSPIMREGCVHSGEWIDIMIGIDWLVARMGEDIFSTLKAAKKIPFTDADDDGIALIINQVRARLALAMGTLFLAFDSNLGKFGYLLTFKKAAEVPVVERGHRLYSGIKFKATFAGAVHLVGIAGDVGA